MTAVNTLERSADTVPSREELVARADGLRDLLSAGAADSDRNRRLNDSTVEALDRAGLSRLFVPRRFGGYETDTRTMLDVGIALARGDGAAGWVTGVSTAASYMVGLLSDQAQQEIWGSNPDTRMAGILAPSAKAVQVDGGYEVTGRWGYMSGCLHAHWATISFPLEHMGGMPAMAVAPLSDLKIEDTWFTTGLRGTGSNTAVADRLFVPAHRVAPLPPSMEGQPVSLDLIEKYGQSLYRSSFSGVLLLSLLGTMIGEAQAALEIVVEKAPSRPITTTNYTRQTDSVAFQLDIAQSSARIDAALQVARQAADEVDAYARSGDYPPPEKRAETRLKCAFAAKTINEAMEVLMSAHGTSAFAENNPLARLWRDISLAARHAGLGYRISEEIYGRVLLDLDPRAVSFVL